MKVAIVHYHLRRGGVTRVIEHALASLSRGDVQVLLCTGEPPPGNSFADEEVAVVPGLGYGGRNDDTTDYELAAELEKAANRHLGGLPDVWHVHNHSLGKNVALPGALRNLARRGHRLLLQLHDVAEDGRPASYRGLAEHCRIASPDIPVSQLLYPGADHVHYATINERDHAIFRRAGVGADQLHLLPNAVALEPVDPAMSAPRDPRLFLYPTRAIRRKNLGEFLLWASLADAGSRFGVTLAPQNPAMRAIYQDWVHYARGIGLPVTFEYGSDFEGSFAELMATAQALVTTSVAEGFGLAFLESCLVQRPILGRDLPEITDSFGRAGIDLSGLYSGLYVPRDWFDFELFETKMSMQIQSAWAAYGRTPTGETIQRVIDAACRDETVEFGKLDEQLQKQVIEHLADQPSLRDHLPFAGLSDRLPDPGTLAANREAVANHFSLEAYGRRLTTRYEAVRSSTPTSLSAIDGEIVLDEFLAPERFTLLRTGI